MVFDWESLQVVLEAVQLLAVAVLLVDEQLVAAVQQQVAAELLAVDVQLEEAVA